MAKKKVTDKRSSLSVLIEAVLKGFEKFCRDAALKPFTIENHNLMEVRAEWRDKDHGDDMRVEQHFVLCLVEHEDDHYDDEDYDSLVESKMRLALDLPKAVTDGDEWEKVAGRRVWLTSGRKRGWPDDVMDRLQLIALQTLADYDDADFSEYPHVKEVFMASRDAGGHPEAQRRGSDANTSERPADAQRA